MKIEVATKKYFKEKKFIEETIDFPENIKELLDRAADIYFGYGGFDYYI